MISDAIFRLSTFQLNEHFEVYLETIREIAVDSNSGFDSTELALAFKQ